ncbi:MAG: SDR family oxidoreductase [Inquilinus limosus]|uniref:SDR family oxidoreductase n=1 Tax=Inquilinus limosus TaxID=171674 RepID=A0A952FPQ1_9PROT|nr:SDR family oxidoreductase [Inquilinus limosus]
MTGITRPLEGQIALVTGASRGLGAAVAVRLAAAGAHVVCAARTVGGLEQTDDAIKAVGGSATLVPMDLFKFEQIDLLGGSLAQRFGKLDLLVANAAMLGHLGPVAYSDQKVWGQVLDLNLNANYRLIRSVDAVAKAGLDTLAGLYAAETAKTPLRVALFHPGPMATRLREQGFPGEAANAQPAPDAAADRLAARLLAGDGLTAGKVADWD